MTTEENVQVVKNFFAALGGSDRQGLLALTAEDIAEILVWVASRPPHVNIDEILVKPVDQAAIGKVFRRKTN